MKFFIFSDSKLLIQDKIMFRLSLRGDINDKDGLKESKETKSYQKMKEIVDHILTNLHRKSQIINQYLKEICILNILKNELNKILATISSREFYYKNC